MNGLSTAQILVNNAAIAYIPNSLKIKDGLGDTKVRPEVVGKGQVQNVVTEDAETKKGSVKFSIASTIENAENVREWKSLFDANVLEVVTEGYQRTFTAATLVNDPEISIAADGVIDLEWESDPAS